MEYLAILRLDFLLFIFRISGMMTASGLEGRSRQFDQLWFQTTLLQLPHGRINIVLDPFQLHLSILDDGVRGTGIAIARLANAPRIQYLTVSQIEMKWDMGVARANEIGFHIFESPPPGIGIGGQVFIHRIARCCVNQIKSKAVQNQVLRNGEL